jgi:hypothetical protein
MKTATMIAVLWFGLAGCAGEGRLPDAAASSYPFDEASSHVILNQLGDEKCELQGKLAAMPVDREVEIVGEIYGEYRSDDAMGNLEVRVAGATTGTGSSLRRSENVLVDGRMTAASRLWIKSNEIASVYAKGDIKGGRCIDLKLRVSDSLPSVLARSSR